VRRVYGPHLAAAARAFEESAVEVLRSPRLPAEATKVDFVAWDAGPMAGVARLSSLVRSHGGAGRLAPVEAWIESLVTRADASPPGPLVLRLLEIAGAQAIFLGAHALVARVGDPHRALLRALGFEPVPGARAPSGQTDMWLPLGEDVVEVPGLLAASLARVRRVMAGWT
jgi:hypothetical protein